MVAVVAVRFQGGAGRGINGGAADAFIDGIIMPVLDNKLLPTSGGRPRRYVSRSAGAVAEPTAAADNGDVAERLADGTLRLRSASIRATNGVGESFISSLAHWSCRVMRMCAADRDDTGGQGTRYWP